MDKKPKIMGILNVTPDSFYDGGRYLDTDRAVERALQLKEDGADIIDIGGESTRPGAEPVSAAEEMDRVCPVIQAVAGNAGVPVSVDTYKSDVADAALSAGASIVNDISGLTFDSRMCGVVARHNAGLVLMHIRGKPDSMQDNTVYTDLTGEICEFLLSACEKAKNCGISRDRIIVDPGIGFGKSLEDNYVILNNLQVFRDLGYTLLIGLSRKSLVKVFGNGDRDTLAPTIALNVYSVLNGADIIRVHDVREHRLALDSIEMLRKVS